MNAKGALRPRIIANLAISVDGKIDSVQREGGGFSSRRDRERLDRLRGEVDVLIVGAETVRREDPPLRIRDPERRRSRLSQGRAEELIVVVVSRGAGIGAGARFLREPAQARLLAIPVEGSATAHPGLELLRVGKGELDLQALVAALVERGASEILVEGGGELIAAFLEADLLDELYLTICPALIGGRGAPTLVGGEGWRLADRRRLTLLEIERHGDDLFLHYRLDQSSVPRR